MPPRTFDGTDDRVTTAAGQANIAFGTMACVLDKTGGDGAARSFLVADNAGSGTWNMRTDAANLLNHRAIAAPTITITAAQGWQFVCITKATGTVAARAHRYIYDTRTWTHENFGTAVADYTTTITAVQIGCATPGTQHFQGDIAAAGCWAVAMTDQQVESLAHSLMAWWQIPPRAVWLLDQASTAIKVLDRTGKGANESAIVGTAIGTTSAPFSYGA